MANENYLQPPMPDLPDTTSATVKNEEEQDEAPPPIVSSSRHGSKKDKITEELLHQKEKLERERVCGYTLTFSSINIFII